MHKLSAVPLSLAFIALAGTAAFADSQDSAPEIVVVSATRTAEPLSRTGESIDVITAADLTAQQTLIVSNALGRTPGLTVVRNGGPGQVTTVGLRGAGAGQTLMLVDGVRLNDPSTTDGEALLGDLFVNDIDRIEVLRGPQSTLYGSDAIGGVVDIVTKRGGTTPLALTASAEGGSFDTYRLNAAANGSLADFDYGAAVNYFHSNGISAADSRNGNSEKDGTGNLGLAANTRYRFNSQISLDLRGFYSNARTEFDDNYLPPSYRLADSPVYSRDVLFSGYAGLNVALFDGRWRNRVAYIGMLSRRTTYDSPYYLPLQQDYFYRGATERFEYQGIVDLSQDEQITYGAETERRNLTSTIAGYPDAAGHTRTTGYYAQMQSTLFSQLTLTGGVRYDDDQEFGGHTSLKFAGAWTPNNGATVLRANYGDGFKAPTLYELFSVYSNPLTALKPESAHGWEAGIDQSIFGDAVRASLTYFERRTSNQIDFFSCYFVTSAACALRSTVGGYYYNIGRSRAEGIEAEVHARIGQTLSLSLNLTDMHAIDLASSTDLARRPHLLAHAYADWTPLKDWSFGLGLDYTGKRFDSAGGYSPLPDYTLVDLYVSRRIGEHLELYGRIDNLFDHRYEPVAGYGAMGRALYAGIRATY